MTMLPSLHLMKLSDENLHDRNQILARRERALLKVIIDHLRETERRRLFAKYGYSSLFEYVTRELKICAGSAQIRIDAMRFAIDVPEAKDKIAAGEVSMSTVATLQKFIRNEKKIKCEVYTQEQKKKLLAMAVGKPRRETEEVLATVSPQSVPRREEIRPVNSGESQVTLVISAELLKKVKRLKEVLPGGHGNTLVDVLDEAVTVALKKYDPLSKTVKANGDSKCEKMSSSKIKPKVTAETMAPSQRPYIPIGIRASLHRETGSQCAFVSSVTLQRCDATHSLQVEHKVPFAKGESSQHENLTLFCPAHQQLSALDQFGESKMKKYLFK